MSSVVRSWNPTAASWARSVKSARRVRMPAWMEDVLEIRPSRAACQKKEPWVSSEVGDQEPRWSWPFQVSRWLRGGVT